jgi:hypothetical protein
MPKKPQRVFRTRGEFCREFFPKSHAEKTCGCYPQERGFLVIQPRKGRQIRVI